jgi:tRNA(fMet)-specific endonuclease VapC
MSGEIALDTSVAVRFLNGDTAVVTRVLALPDVVLPIVVVGELLFGAENSNRPLQNLPRYLEFIEACLVLPLQQFSIKPTTIPYKGIAIRSLRPHRGTKPA